MILKPNLVIPIHAEQYLILVSLLAGCSSRTFDKGWWHVCFHMCWMSQLISGECLWNNPVVTENCPSKRFSHHFSEECQYFPREYSNSCQGTSFRLPLILMKLHSMSKKFVYYSTFLPRDWTYSVHFGAVSHCGNSLELRLIIITVSMLKRIL